MSSAESQEPASSTKKDNDNENGRTNTTAKDPHHSNPLFKKEREIWQTVPPKGQHTRPPRRGPHRGGRMASNTASGASSKSAPHQKQRNEGPEEIRGRGFRGRRGRGRGSKLGRSQGRGAAGKYVFFLPLLTSYLILTDTELSDGERYQQGSQRTHWFEVLLQY